MIGSCGLFLALCLTVPCYARAGELGQATDSMTADMMTMLAQMRGTVRQLENDDAAVRRQVSDVCGILLSLPDAVKSGKSTPAPCVPAENHGPFGLVPAKSPPPAAPDAPAGQPSPAGPAK